MDGDGQTELTAWTHQNSGLAFLALDRNGNGKIDNGTELFGNHTFPGAKNGFMALRRDAGSIGEIMEGVPLYEKLLLWEDANHDGVSQPEELHKFSDHYLGISEGYVPDRLMDKNGNLFKYQGTATVRDPGKSKKYPMGPGEDVDLLIPIYDVWFRTTR